MGKKTTRRKNGTPRSAGGAAQRRGFDYGWVILAATVAIGIAVIALTTRGQAPVSPAPKAAAPAPSAVLAAEIRDARVGEVEQRFRCPCGRCGGKELTDCTCDSPGGALEMKAAIVALLDAGSDVDATVAAIAARFPGALKEASEAARSAPLEKESSNEVLLEVARRIDCPCGNCSLRLIDCDCKHDRGAREVKAFVRERARSGRTTSEIIAAFDRVYGGTQG